jgi:branched-chain amino acid:cation transporter, LIVCS family
MTKSTPIIIFSTALAIFAMFFGAGNVVFPLLLGKLSGDQNRFAIAGLLITSIGGPLIGLFGSILFEGNFKEFFFRVGKVGGYILMIVSAAILGPLAVMPRCMIVAYAALQPFFPVLPLWGFSIIATLVALLLLFKRSSLLSILGYVLSPILITLLVMVIVKGMISPSQFVHVESTPMAMFTLGLFTGYDTMDLIASIFFSVSIWHLLRAKLHDRHAAGSRKVIHITIASGAISGVLLGLIYVGLSHVTAKHIPLLQNVQDQDLLVSLSSKILGPGFSAVANCAVALACLTTIMGLAITFSEIFRKDFFAGKIPHKWTVVIIMVITGLFSNLGFSTIMSLIHPIVTIFYPSIIVLTLCNIAYKMWGWRSVRIPVAAAFLCTLIFGKWG